MRIRTGAGRRCAFSREASREATMAVREAKTDLRRTAEEAAGPARRQAESGSGWYAWLARGGLVAKGISYGIVGVLALQLALGAGGKATSRQGALQTLARHGYGKALLVLLALGFAA